LSRAEKVEFITFDPKKATLKEVHNLLLGGVAPRPIALVSTISKSGINNLAPFSFFNAFGANPPYVAFSPSYSGKDGSAKDTLINVQDIPECVVHAVSYSIVQQINLASTPYVSGIDEILKAGFTPIKSDVVKPKRIKESPVHMECRVDKMIPLGGISGSGNLVLCQVLKFHIEKSLLKEDSIDPHHIDLVGRNSGSYYTRASGNAIFEVAKPTDIGMGIDQLPKYIQESKILTGNNLGQLGGLPSLPTDKQVMGFIESFNKNDGKIQNKENERLHYSVLCGLAYSIFSEDSTEGKKLIETASKKALDENDIDFAIKALLSINLL
jgi:flavin reductase (DIM6/NTAB) family NADH-FMN oxidoreductase RutF